MIPTPFSRKSARRFKEASDGDLVLINTIWNDKKVTPVSVLDLERTTHIIRMKTKFIVFFIAALASLILTGCIGVPGKLPPTYTYEQIPQVRPKPAIYYDAKFLSDGKEHAESTAGLGFMVKMVFLESEVFSKVELAPESDGYHISVKLEAESNESMERLSKAVSVLTLYLIPTYAHYPVTLTIDVKRANDLLKQYVYKDYMDIWRHLFLVVVPRPTNRAFYELLEHMLLKFVHDVTEDQILIISETSPGSLLKEGEPDLYKEGKTISND